MTLRLVLSVLFHLLKHFFLGHTLFAARAAWSVTFVIIMLVIRAIAEIRRVGFVAVHALILVSGPAMHHAHRSYNTAHNS